MFANAMAIAWQNREINFRASLAASWHWHSELKELSCPFYPEAASIHNAFIERTICTKK